MEPVKFLCLGAVSIGGTAVAGYLGLYEILVEYLVIVVLLFVAANAATHPKKKLLELVRHGEIWQVAIGSKQAKVGEFLLNPGPSLAARILLPGVAFGWFLCLMWFPARGWRFVVSREIKESLLDLLVMPALLALVAWMLRPIYNREEKTKTDVDDVGDASLPPWPEFETDSASDPDSQYAEPIGGPWLKLDNTNSGLNNPYIAEAVATAGRAFTVVHFRYYGWLMGLMLLNSVAFCVGFWIASCCPVDLLEQAKRWSV